MQQLIVASHDDAFHYMPHILKLGLSPQVKGQSPIAEEAKKTGTLIKRAQITRDTLRYYEREGVITTPSRSANGYRDYPERVLEEISFIRLGQSVGLALSVIRRAIPGLAESGLP